MARGRGSTTESAEGVTERQHLISARSAAPSPGLADRQAKQEIADGQAPPPPSFICRRRLACALHARRTARPSEHTSPSLEGTALPHACSRQSTPRLRKHSWPEPCSWATQLADPLPGRVCFRAHRLYRDEQRSRRGSHPSTVREAVSSEMFYRPNEVCGRERMWTAVAAA